VQVAGAVRHVAMRIVAGEGDQVQRTGDGRTGRVFGCRAIERSAESCAVCTVHVEMRSTNFLIEPQNQGRWFISDLASKSLGQFLRFGLKTGADGFLVEPQNQGGGGFPGLGLKTSSYGLLIWA
jgi:hypothetical protein